MDLARARGAVEPQPGRRRAALAAEQPFGVGERLRREHDLPGAQVGQGPQLHELVRPGQDPLHLGTQRGRRRAGLAGQHEVDSEQRGAGLEQVAALGELGVEHRAQLVESGAAHQVVGQRGRVLHTLADQRGPEPDAEQAEPLQQRDPGGGVGPVEIGASNRSADSSSASTSPRGSAASSVSATYSSCRMVRAVSASSPATATTVWHSPAACRRRGSAARSGARRSARRAGRRRSRRRARAPRWCSPGSRGRRRGRGMPPGTARHRRAGDASGRRRRRRATGCPPA